MKRFFVVSSWFCMPINLTFELAEMNIPKNIIWLHKFTTELPHDDKLKTALTFYERLNISFSVFMMSVSNDGCHNFAHYNNFLYS